jgi:hypothetical protein
MTLRLVSEARPIPWEQLSKPEQAQLKDADGWIKAVVGDAKREKSAANEIDKNRSGRVLFIDGQRGAGKTSLLLTLLEQWKGYLKSPEYEPPTANLRVLSPVLDFDPLPRGMPLHGWLLEPWRKEAESLEAKDTSGAGSKDLSEMWAEVFERVVIGWTHATVEGKGVVEKAIAYQEQASGWIDTRANWHKFVNATVCRTIRPPKDACSPKGTCNVPHPYIFVVAIDDVDLQVEQVPLLLHAIRLLHHPNVVYVLTGNYEHLRFVLELDYIGRHEHLTHNRRQSEPRFNDELWTKTKMYSSQLSDALIEKALPSHARLTLPHLNFDDVLKFAAGDGTIKDTLDLPTLGALSAAARTLEIVTARQAQHAIDRHLDRLARETKKAATLELLADLCGTDIETADATDENAKAKDATDENAKAKFMIRGELTTWSGPILKILKGDQLKVVFADQPLFVFHPDFDDTGVPVKEEAHRALLVQLVVEKEGAPVVAHALEWKPDEGIVTTEVEWDPHSKKVGRTAVFHWPWLVRLSAAEALKLGALSGKMNRLTGNSLSHLEEKTIAVWLLENIEWCLKAPKKDGKLPSFVTAPSTGSSVETKAKPTFAEFAGRLKLLWEQNDPEIKEEVQRWASELYVMTAPYFGLPPEVANDMRLAIEGCKLNNALNEEELLKAQDTMIGNAITARVASGRKSRQPESVSDLSEKELKDLTKLFLEQRKKRSAPNDIRWAKLEPKSRDQEDLAGTTDASHAHASLVSPGGGGTGGEAGDRDEHT